MARNIVSFDWALKYTLRDKANFDVLEGLLTTILGRKVKIDDILESESNKAAPDERMIRLDLKARLDGGELALIEFQYKPEHHFFSRLLFYTSKTLIEHAESGSDYSDLPKVYTIAVCDFKLGKGDDYVYHGQQKFVGIHTQQELELTQADAKRLSTRLASKVFPEYIIISLSNFPDQVRSHLDEWLYALKIGQVEDAFSAPGLEQAAERLDMLKLSKEEQQRHQHLGYIQQIAKNQLLAELAEADWEGELRGLTRGRAEGREQRDRELILRAHQKGLSAQQIAEFLDLDLAFVQAVIDEQS